MQNMESTINFQVAFLSIVEDQQNFYDIWFNELDDDLRISKAFLKIFVVIVTHLDDIFETLVYKSFRIVSISD